MAFDKKLLEILACPVCKGKLQYQAKDSELICRFDRLAFPIKDNIPVMLENEARELTSTDIENLDKG
ncbi:MAG: Trm112 family protein [Aliiglaciecola sp.]|uniref:Trm112 family protein n=1 Tax=unclassified Aliiglaciecola TaxID=2593648 RepID=UPI003296A770